MIQRIAVGFVLLCLTQLSFADEIRPGYLEIKENSKDVFSVLWKVPAKGDKKLSLQAQLPANCENKTQANTQFINASYIQRWIMERIPFSQHLGAQGSASPAHGTHGGL